MDDYPEPLAPVGIDTFSKEPFQAWWARVNDHYPAVPRNVARQWLWRHWGHSEFRWLPSEGARFELELWQPDDVVALQIWREGESKYSDWGNYLLSRAGHPKGHRYKVAWIMKHRRAWPAPPIVLDHDGRFSLGFYEDLATGVVLIEGNRRVAMAKALAGISELRADLPVWVLRY